MQLIDDDGELCIHLANIASEILLGILAQNSLCPEDVGKMADNAANNAILNELKRQRPTDAILSEESIDDLARLNSNRVWIIDPIDGTLEYTQNRNDWAVHIGLAINGNAEIGAVAIPTSGKVYSTNEKVARFETKSQRKPIITVSRSRPPIEIEALAKHLDAQVVFNGSAGYKAMQIINGEADIYFHTGGQSEWDNCAPIAVAKANGLFVGDIFGNEIKYNRQNVMVPNLLICRPEFEKTIINWSKRNIQNVD